MKVLLISVDGMRPDALPNCELAEKYIKNSTYTMEESSVIPSVTLPCHMSMFHSVTPARHGTTTNMHTPQVRPINGLCEVLRAAKKKSAFFYNWEQLRDLSRPGSLSFAYFNKGGETPWDASNNTVTDAAIEYISNNHIDFTFLYLGYLDEAGHAFGWMSEEYFKALENSWQNIDKIVNALPDDYVVIVTADHGGHERCHGTDLPEDMTIPFIAFGNGIEAGKVLEEACIIDIPPTVAKLLGVESDEDWEGKALL